MNADVGIIGGGLAGSLAAAMLGRAGISTVLIDTHETYPGDFRSEKFETRQIMKLEKTGLCEEIVHSPLSIHIDEIWIARRGRLIAKRSAHQYGIAYGDAVNVTRALVPKEVQIITGRALDIKLSGDRQTISLGDREISVRLVIMATGLNNALRENLKIIRREISKCHSISVGFDMKAVGRKDFDFPALTYIGENKTNRINYLSLRPLPPPRQLAGATQRANMFLYRDKNDPWIRELRKAPIPTMAAAMPKLKKLLGDYEITSNVIIRPVDLYVTEGYRQGGVVLIGDSFSTSCPAAGTGVDKVLVDVVQLCRVHVPEWLTTPGMGVEKINAFYDDPEKIASEEYSKYLAYYLRSLTLDDEFSWRFRRTGWYYLERVEGKYGIVRTLREHGVREALASLRQPSPAVPILNSPTQTPHTTTSPP